jgi:ankyrin repeat protein
MGNLAMVRCLVEELGADVNKADLKGRTPFWIATYGGNLAMLRVLVKELHADVDKVDQAGYAPLWIAAQDRRAIWLW